jgi:sarcosine oxidase
VDAALRFALADAAQAGARLELETKVEGWQPRDGHYEVRTPGGRFQARRLVITAGAWAGELLRDLAIPLRVIRKSLVWVDPLRPDLFQSGSMPVFASAAQFFYGFPMVGGKRAVKLAIHWSEDATPGDPDEFQAHASAGDQEQILEAAAALLPDLAGPLPGALARVIGSKTCLYTMTPDEHFVIDRHPLFDGVCFAAGFSGHGFKFAPAIGEALADLAITGSTTLPIAFLQASRFGRQYPVSETGTHGPGTEG